MQNGNEAFIEQEDAWDDFKERTGYDSEHEQLESFAADIAGEQQDFAYWIDSSQATTSAGRPISLFHGTHSKFDEFDFEVARDGAHWFTPMESHAASFGPVKEFFLAIKNPMVISQTDLEDAWDVEHPDGEQDERSLLPRSFVEDFVKRAKELGYDSLIIRDMGDRDIESDMFLPFRPDQIRPAASYPFIEGVYLNDQWKNDIQREKLKF